MARNITLLNVRNTRIRADFNRLKCEEVIIKNRGEMACVKLTYSQILHILSLTHCLSVRTLESIVIATEPVLAPITPSPTHQLATA